MIDGSEKDRKPLKLERDEEPPLTLADSSEGSTQPIPGASGAPASASSSESSSAGSSSVAGVGESAAGASGSPGASQAAGATTGGFETMLGKLIVRAGFVTDDEVALCQAELEAAAGSGSPGTLADVLVARDFATQHQLGRLRQEFEAKKSGQHIHGFQIIRKLGSGAMATVFLAKQISLDRPVAIKILPKKFSANEKFIERFYREGRSAAQLNHPNIVAAYDVGRSGDHHYFVMEYVEGVSLHEKIQKHKRIGEKDAIAIVKQVATALEHAHDRGFIHRDIKPKNIMINRRGRVKLADLGLARAISDREAARAEAGRAYGTPYYISPEQIRGEVNITAAADIYGLGATFYHMVTGRVPYEGKNPSAVMHRHLKNPLEPPDHVNPEISAGTAQIIEMMMAKKVEDRYRRAIDLLEDLKLVGRGQPPHFAHRTLDRVSMSDAITDAATAPAQIVEAPRPAAPPLMQNPLFLTLLAVLIASAVFNLILLSVVLSR